MSAGYGYGPDEGGLPDIGDLTGTGPVRGYAARPRSLTR